jgi:choline dehydrogenase-like flavoprotein
LFSRKKNKMTGKIYDFLVIGAGSGGIASARRAASYGASVGIIEAGKHKSHLLQKKIIVF